MTRAANVMLLSPDGKLILQLRDDKPDINRPGQVTAFGGGCEKDEEPLEAAKREMKEELGLHLSDTDLKLWKVFRKTMAEYGEDSLVSLYVLKYPLQPEKLTVLEGQGYVLVSAEDDFASIKLTPAARQFVPDFFKDHPSHD